MKPGSVSLFLRVPILLLELVLHAAQQRKRHEKTLLTLLTLCEDYSFPQSGRRRRVWE
jgi:hypothetical protein